MLFIFKFQLALPFFQPKALLFLEEVWADVPNIENYQISNWGRIKNVRTGHMMVGWRKRKGYLAATFRKRGKNTSLAMHRLVATVFVPNPENKPEVNHKDGIKWHNYAWNLEWCTREENMDHAYHVLKLKFGGNKLPKKIICLTTGKIYDSAKQAALKFNITPEYLRKVIRDNDGVFRERKLKFSFYYENEKPFTNPAPETLGLVIKLRMYEMGLKQSALAKLLNLTPSTITAIINNHRKPSMAVLKLIHKELGIDGNLLLKLI